MAIYSGDNPITITKNYDNNYNIVTIIATTIYYSYICHNIKIIIDFDINNNYFVYAELANP